MYIVLTIDDSCYLLCVCFTKTHAADTLFSFQKWSHVQLLRKTDKSVEFFLVACLSRKRNKRKNAPYLIKNTHLSKILPKCNTVCQENDVSRHKAVQSDAAPIKDEAHELQIEGWRKAV